MKAFVFVLLVAFIAAVQSLEITAEQKAEGLKNVKECAELSGLSEEDLTKLKEETTAKTLDKEKVKKHFLCLAKKSHYINDEGKLDIEVIKKRANDVKATPEELAKILDCAVEKQDAEHTALHFLICKYKSVHAQKV